MPFPPRFLISYDEGQGERLFVGLDNWLPTFATGELRRWDGAQWSAVGGGLIGRHFSAAVFDPDGPGPNRPGLYVAGSFSQAGAIDAAYFVRWDGSSWERLHRSLSDKSLAHAPEVQSMLAINGDAPTLIIGGFISDIDDTPAEHLVTYRMQGPIGDLNGDFSVDFADLVILLANFGTLSGATHATGDLDEDADIDLSDLALFWSGFGDDCP